jgi:hypothetical protein
MALEPLVLPDVDLEGLSGDDRAKLNEWLRIIQEKVNEAVAKLNAEFP